MGGSRRGLTRILAVCAVPLSWVLTAAPAFAQYPGGGETPPVVRGEKFFRNPRTGADVVLFVVIALLLLLAGIALHLFSKRSRVREA